MESLVRCLAEAGNVLPEAALRDAAARWEDGAARPLLDLLEAFADGRDRSEPATSAVFFAAFLFGQMREARAFPALCRLAEDPEGLEQALGDAVTEAFAGILAATWDGAIAPLQALMLSEQADEFACHAAFDALTILALDGRVAPDAAEAVLRTVHDRLLARDEARDMVWVGWAMAVGLLGLDALRPQAQAMFRRGRIDRTFMDRRDFEEDLRQGIAAREDPAARDALIGRHRLRPAGDAVEVLSRWHGFTEAGRREAEAEERQRARARLDAAMVGAPVAATGFDLRAPATNALRGVGRNDPCPCGSGRKFKKCCLGAA